MSLFSEARVAAVDLGASSGRVIAGHCSAHGFALREVHRFPNTPIRAGGGLRWDVLGLFRGILDGLRLAEDQLGGLDSVGIDSWAVDYGLLDSDGQLLGNPRHYRDPRTAATVSRVLEMVGAEELYAANGTQLQPFNTVFQLLADCTGAQFAAARTALLIPDLMTYWLSGVLGTELTNASTTGLLDPRTMAWSSQVAEALDIPLELFPALRAPGTIVGQMLPDVASDAGLSARPRVVSVASHDTASAVAGIPAESDRFAYVCSGTWALVGLELPGPVITESARAANFTNEVGVDGTIRFLRNVTGFWLLQECSRQWRASGLPIDLDDLTEAAGNLPPSPAVIDVQDPAFTTPGGDMLRRIADASQYASGTVLDGPAEITRCILDSVAVAVRHAVRDATRLAGRVVDVVHIVGGGVANPLFCQLVADACGLPVIAGPAEAAAWGNALSQAQALGVISASTHDARATIRTTERTVRYAPRTNEALWVRFDDMVLGARSAQT